MRVKESRQLRIESIIGSDTPDLFRIYEAELLPSGADTAIIFVHGFISNSIKTWGLDDNYYFWPFHVGSETNSDVYCLEYLNNSVKNSSRSGLDMPSLSEIIIDKLYSISGDYKNIIFVTHSFGGVLIKYIYTCIVTHKDPGVIAIAEKIKGIFMISCPHRGHALAYGFKVLLWMIMTKNFMLMGSKKLTVLHEDFLRIYFKNRTNTKCETVGETGFLYHVFRVNSEDARLDKSTVHHVDERNHSSICKNIKIKDNIFKYIVAFIENSSKSGSLRDGLDAPLWKL